MILDPDYGSIPGFQKHLCSYQAECLVAIAVSVVSWARSSEPPGDNNKNPSLTICNSYWLDACPLIKSSYVDSILSLYLGVSQPEVAPTGTPPLASLYQLLLHRNFLASKTVTVTLAATSPVYPNCHCRVIFRKMQTKLRSCRSYLKWQPISCWFLHPINLPVYSSNLFSLLMRKIHGRSQAK